MHTNQSAGRDKTLMQPRRLIQSLVTLAVGVLLVQISRVTIKVLSPWTHVTDTQRAWLYFVPLAVVLLVNGYVVFRLRDRLLRSMYATATGLLLSTHLITLTRILPNLPQILITIMDTTALVLLAGVVFRNALLLINSYQQRHERVLENLAWGTSHRVGQDFLAGLVESTTRTLKVDLVFVSELQADRATESVLAVAKAEDVELRRPLDAGQAVDCSEASLATLVAGRSVLSLPLTNSDGHSIGHLVLLHQPLAITTGHRYSLQIFASRASAELQRLQSDRRNRELESRMLQGQKMESLGVLAGGIAHDFNNLLQAIRSYSTLAAEASIPDTASHEAISRVDGVVDKGAMMCDRLLAYAGKSVRRNTDCSINQIVLETVQIVQAARPDCRLTLRLSDEPLPVWGDPSQLSQVLMNLLTNAADAMDSRNGDVVVQTQRSRHDDPLIETMNPANDGDCAVIQVIDQGCGISADAGNRIFDPFYSSKGEGRGIGLASVAGIVKNHQGDISFTSKLHVGTTFVVALPMTDAREQPTPALPVHQKALSDLSVLLVDDDEMIRVSTSMLLETAGVSVTTATSGDHALEVIAERGDVFSAIVMDQTMPGLSGLQTCHRLRDRGVMCPVILMSGYSDVPIDEELHQVRFVAKPYSREELLEALSIAADPAITDSEQTGRAGKAS